MFITLDSISKSSYNIQVGYREGITAGKEGALQEGFDAGFADVGTPLGRDLGLLRGISAAILSFVNGSLANSFDGKEEWIAEIRDISSQLSRIRFSDVVPRDLEAEEHARQHMEQEGVELDMNEEIAAKRDVEGLEDMLEKLSAGNSKSPLVGGRPTMDDVLSLKTRLVDLGNRLDLRLDWI